MSCQLALTGVWFGIRCSGQATLLPGLLRVAWQQEEVWAVWEDDALLFSPGLLACLDLESTPPHLHPVPWLSPALSSEFILCPVPAQKLLNPASPLPPLWD